MGALLACVIFGLLALLCAKLPVDWYMPYLRWWKTEGEAEEIQNEVKWASVMFFGGISVLCLGVHIIDWWTGR